MANINVQNKVTKFITIVYLSDKHLLKKTHSIFAERRSLIKTLNHYCSALVLTDSR